MKPTSLKAMQAMLCGRVIPLQRTNVHNSVSIKPINPNVLLQFSWLALVLSIGMSFSGHLSI